MPATFIVADVWKCFAGLIGWLRSFTRARSWLSVELFPTPVEPMATIFFTDMLGWVLVECCCSVFENNADESIEVKKNCVVEECTGSEVRLRFALRVGASVHRGPCQGPWRVLFLDPYPVPYKCSGVCHAVRTMRRQLVFVDR